MADILVDIRTALLTALRYITKAHGYRSDIGTVSDEFVASDAAVFPAVFVISVGSEQVDMAGGVTEVQDKINIYAVVKSKSAPQAALNSIVSDIRQALASAQLVLPPGCLGFRVRRSANAGDIYNMEGYAPGHSPPHACIRIECEAVYQFTRTLGG